MLSQDATPQEGHQKQVNMSTAFCAILKPLQCSPGQGVMAHVHTHPYGDVLLKIYMTPSLPNRIMYYDKCPYVISVIAANICTDTDRQTDTITREHTSLVRWDKFHKQMQTKGHVHCRTTRSMFTSYSGDSFSLLDSSRGFEVIVWSVSNPSTIVRAQRALLVRKKDMRISNFTDWIKDQQLALTEWVH